jgi:flavorubredoxin
MPIVHAASGTRIDEVEDGIHRISVPVREVQGGFSFNQYLVVDREPLLFHTGPGATFELVRAAIEHVMPMSRLRWVSFAHVEADECGAYADVLAAAPSARPLCGRTQAMLAVGDMTDRDAHVLADGESYKLGKRTVTWFDAPHVPHGWDNGYLFEKSTRTLFASDLFTQAGADGPAVTDADVLGASEAMRAKMDYFSHAPTTGAVLERLAAAEPALIAAMHGSAYRGDGARLLRDLARALR